jgi:DNA-binding PadR family transcriptional regulator
MAPMSPIWFQILLALADADRHGIAIMQEVLERTQGNMRLWPGMLYRNLQKLEAERLIEEIDSATGPMAGSPRFFRLTAAGRRACAAEARRLATYVDAAREKQLFNKKSR